jgi:hypothetical protein
MDMGNLSQLSKAVVRSISPENSVGKSGKGGMATEGTGSSASREPGQGWKVSPSIYSLPRATAALPEIDGPGAIQHIWLTVAPEW